MKRIAGIVILLLGLLSNAHAVPPVLNYAGQVTVNGEAFDGNGLFKFALVNSDENATYWSNDGTSVNGYEPQASVSVAVNGGLYAVLIGNTAQQGMGPIDPSIFTQHTDAKLRVWFSDGVNGFQQLSPDRPFASVPYAFSAGTAQTAGSATIAPGSIDRSMLSGDIRSDLNRTISHNDLSPQIKADINATIGLDRLSSEVILKLEQNATITNGSVTGSKMADRVITTDKLNEQILKYLKPEITSQPQAQTVYADTNVSYSVTAEGKYLTYQWKKDGLDLIGETNATLNITDANATLHDGNYSVVVGNDFGSVESGALEIKVIDSIMNGLVAWWKFDEINGTVAYDSSGNGNAGNLTLGATWTDGIIGNAISFNTSQYMTSNVKYKPASDASGQSYSAWVKVEGQSWRVFGSNASGNGEIHLSVNGGQNHITFGTTSFGSGNNGESPNTVNIPITLGWHNVILIKQANKYELFFDGSSLIADMQRNTSNTSTNFNLGRRYANSSQYYSGTIDDVRIYDRALSAEEVQALYNMGQ